MTTKEMGNIYAEDTGDGHIAIHCDLITAERIYEGICKVFAEYPREVSSDCREEKRKLANLKNDIERLLPHDRSWV